MPKTKPKTEPKKKRLKRNIDTENGTFELKGETFSLIGVPQSLYVRLALEGAYALLKNSSDPVKRWQRILKGTSEVYPLVVKAISELTDTEIKSVYSQWKSMEKIERRKYLNDPSIKSKMLSLKSGSTVVDLSKFKEPLG